MPELLEVETYRRQAEAVVGRRISHVDTPDAWYLKRAGAQEVRVALVGATVAATRRIGKLLLLDLDGGARLGLRFGMTGRLIVDGVAAIGRLEYSSRRDDPVWDRFTIGFDGAVDGDAGGELRMRDPRRLGGVELEPDEGRLGVDALTMSRDDLVTALGRSAAPLKARLLDQGHVAGIGNLLADELLWRSGLDPARPAGSLTSTEVSRLHEGTIETLDDLMVRGGSHTGDLRAAALDDGRCPRDGAELQRRRIGGRTTVSCPDHQQ